MQKNPETPYEVRAAAEQGGLTRPGELTRARLIIVPKSRVDLYQALKRSFSNDPDTQVILDRRSKDRRGTGGPYEPDRRRGDRRRRTDVEAQLSAGRSVIVPIPWRPGEPFDADARAILILFCGQHVVGCENCRRTYRVRWLPRTDSGRFSCPLCGADITPAVVAHTETCSYWASRGIGGTQRATVERRPGEAATG